MVSFKVQLSITVNEYEQKLFAVLFSAENDGRKPDEVELDSFVQEWFDRVADDMSNEVALSWKDWLREEFEE